MNEFEDIDNLVVRALLIAAEERLNEWKKLKPKCLEKTRLSHCLVADGSFEEIMLHFWMNDEIEDSSSCETVVGVNINRTMLYTFQHEKEPRFNVHLYNNSKARSAPFVYYDLNDFKVDPRKITQRVLEYMLEEYYLLWKSLYEEKIA
jgi:hypothetical protein